MALQRATYRPRDAEHTVLHAVIREHLEPFLQAVSDQGDGGGLPRFVDGYHPSDYGYARWAALMWQGIAARILRATLPRGPAS